MPDINPYLTPPARLTSNPYPIIDSNAMTAAAEVIKGQLYGWEKDQIVAFLELLAGELRQILKSYDNPTESIAAVLVDLLDAEIRQILKSYDGQPESMTLATAELLSGTLEVKLIRYLNWDRSREQIDVACDLISGTLA